MLLGLASATRGSMALFGRSVPQALPEVIAKVGAVVESPKFSPNFTGRQNLLLLARSVGIPDQRVDAAIESVGLVGRDRGRYKTYSLGMKQRLAIAATLLKDPRLLILDEPTNGLDPSGIREVREMVRGLGGERRDGPDQLHILAEVQQVCTAATIIGNGRTLASGTVAELLGSATTQRVVAPDLAAARPPSRPAGSGSPGRTRRRSGRDRSAGRVTRVLGESGVWLTELTRSAPTSSRSSSPSPSTTSWPEPGDRRVIAPALGRAHPTPVAARGARPPGPGLLAPVTSSSVSVVRTEQKSLDDLVGEYGPSVRPEYDSCIQHPQRYGHDDSPPPTRPPHARTGARALGQLRLDLVEQRRAAPARRSSCWSRW